MTSPLSGPPVVQATTAELAARVRALAVPGGRTVLGLTGAPGAGKSTLCSALARALGAQAAVVGMDGFHLANAELDRLGRRDRKGAPDTFDVGGYAALLARLRAGGEDTVYTPTFDRTLEEAIGSAVPVPAGTPLVLTEGNYLLLEDPPWPEVRRQLDAVWFLEVPDEVRVPRLVSRHMAFGKTSPQAEAWAARVDGRNAARIQATRSRADLIVRWTG